MWKNIEIPESTDVHVIACWEWDEDKIFQQWNVYVANLKREPIEMVLVMSRGYSDDKKSSTLRHGLGDIPAREKAKIEMIDEQVFELHNEYLVTYLYDGKMIEKTFTFKPNSFIEDEQCKLADSIFKGIIAE